MSWLRTALGVGAVASGVGAAVVVGSGIAAASPDDAAERPDTAVGQGRDATPRTPRGAARHPSPSPAHDPARQAASRATGPVRPTAASEAVVDATVDVADDVGPEPVSLAGTPAPADPPPSAQAAIPADPGPIQSAILAAQAYIYGYPLMEYQRVRQAVGTVNTLYSLTSFANPDVDPIWQSIGGGKRPNVDTYIHWPNSTFPRVPWCCPSRIWAAATSAFS